MYVRPVGGPENTLNVGDILTGPDVNNWLTALVDSYL